MNKVVLDSSALLAAINREPGGAVALSLITGETMVSAVNAAEVYTKLVRYGAEAAATGMELMDGVQIIPFTQSQALQSGKLIRSTRHLGLSLGDRACLALAIEVGADVYTADRVWSALAVDCSIHLIR